MAPVATAQRRSFLPDQFDTSKWENYEPFFDRLLKKDIAHADDLRNWIELVPD